MLQHNHLFGILDCKPIFLKTSFLKVALLLIDLLEKELFECLLIETWGNALDRRALRKAPKTAVKEIFNWTSYLDPGPR